MIKKDDYVLLLSYVGGFISHSQCSSPKCIGTTITFTICCVVGVRIALSIHLDHYYVGSGGLLVWHGMVGGIGEYGPKKNAVAPVHWNGPLRGLSSNISLNHGQIMGIKL